MGRPIFLGLNITKKSRIVPKFGRMENCLMTTCLIDMFDLALKELGLFRQNQDR